MENNLGEMAKKGKNCLNIEDEEKTVGENHLRGIFCRMIDKSLIRAQLNSNICWPEKNLKWKL